MNIKDIEDCSTYAVRGLDNQLIWQMNQIAPGLLVRIDDLDLDMGQAVHSWVQPAAKECLHKVIALRSQRLTINSAYRTLAGQALLRNHFCCGRCGITAAAPPGESNHNNASAIDVQDAAEWKPYLEECGWHWLGAFDPMHFDCGHEEIKDIHAIATLSFQKLWNLANPHDIISEDGDFGEETNEKLLSSPAEGFYGLPVPRVLKLTTPYQAGNDVGKLQLALRATGITLVADKVFGSLTDEAVKKFQLANGLIADGLVGEKTAALLK